MAQIGKIFKINNKNYMVLNKEGTLEKFNSLLWYAELYLEIMQGMNKFYDLQKLRSFIKKYQKRK